MTEMIGERRRELGLFLRARRERTSPADVGLPGSGRRRTPGLRREELATLAGISTTWYTFLEQGRQVRPSDQVLTALQSCASPGTNGTPLVQTVTADGNITTALQQLFSTALQSARLVQ